MGRKWMCGGEQGHVDVFDIVNGIVSSTTRARGGNRSFYFDNHSQYGQKNLGSGIDELYFRWAVYPEGFGSGTGYALIFQALDSAAAIQISITANTANQLSVRRGSDGGTILGTSGAGLTLNKWHVIELWLKIADSGGEAELKINGVLEVDFNGDTKQTAIADMQHIKWQSGTTGSRFYPCYVDDIAINDTTGAQQNSWIGRGTILGFVPDGAGNYAQFTPSAGSNYQNVEEVPPDDDTTHNEDNVVDQKDSFTMGDIGAIGSISAVCWWARAKMVDGTGNLARLLRIASSDYQGSDLGLLTSYAYVFDILELNPDDSQPWEQADVNGLEAGYVAR